MTTSKTSGFYGNGADLFYVTPTGRVWIVASVDDSPGVTETDELPEDVENLDKMLTAQEAIDYCLQVQEESGEVLIETLD
jgi:hypothetical protein